MKKFLTLILAILYMGSSTGATFHIHYCMGKPVDVQFWNGDNEKCSMCGTDAHKVCVKKCCRDEHKTVKLEKDQKTSENSTCHIQLADIVHPAPPIVLPQIYPVSPVAEYPLSNAPPRSHKVHTHILHCTFRI